MTLAWVCVLVQSCDHGGGPVKPPPEDRRVHRVPQEYARIVDALSAAGDGDTVLVDKGRYMPTSATVLDFQGKAVRLISRCGPDSTVLEWSDSLELAAGAISFAHGEDRRSSLEGITVSSEGLRGTALVLSIGASPSVRDCRFRSRSGTMLWSQISGALLSRCRIEGQPGRDTRAIFCEDASGLVFDSLEVVNVDVFDGYVAECFRSDVRFSNSRFVGNDSEHRNRGALRLSFSTVVLERCLLAKNEASGYGGAIDSAESQVVLESCTVTGNRGQRGGGIGYCWGSRPSTRRPWFSRFRGDPIHDNAQMGIREIERHCRTDDPTRALLHKAMETRSMSARAAHRVLRVARTIADLAEKSEVALDHVAEAVQCQALERAGGRGRVMERLLPARGSTPVSMHHETFVVDGPVAPRELPRGRP